jgi:hydroxyacylglutathione hydrolase
MTMQIVPIPAFNDNYIWLAHDGRHALAVDPGDAAPVRDFIAQNGLTLVAILITHHHGDHTGGLPAFAGQCPVFGPAAEDIPGVTHPVREGDTVPIPELDLRFEVLDLPGHTLGHVAYAAPGMVFCGDTLFSAGCGRLFEGSPAQMKASLAKLAALPPDTRVYCTHEYTLANLAFAQVAEPENPERDAWLAQCQRLRASGQPTLPTTIGRERAINPFLRVDQPTLIEGLSHFVGHVPKDPTHAFAALREWKNNF